MHGGKGREGMALSGSASYHLNGSGSGSGPHGGLPPPPGFELLSNPNVSVHSNVRVSSMDTSFQVEEQNPSPNYTHGINTAVKRKRGRPPKYKTLALSPMSSKVSPGSITLSTPTRKRSKGRLQGSGRKQQLASLVTKEKEDCKRAHGETVLRPCAAEKEGIDKIHEEMNNVGLKERYEECTKRVLELETELQDAKIRLEISECRADKILREKEEKISKLQVENGNLAAELEEARTTIKFFENASKESSKFENFGPKETPEVDIIISSPCKVKHPKERDSRFMETEDSGAFIWQDKNMTISISDTESPPRNNQISNNELESPAPQPQSIGVPLEISSSTEEAKPIVDQLSRLRPPQEQGPSDVLPPGLLEQSMDLVGRVKSFLAEQLTSTTTSDLNKMIDRANKAFATLDWCLADYRSFHCDVRDFIRCRSDRLSAEEERNGHAYAEIVSWHKDLLNQSNDAEEELSNAELELRSAIEKLEPLKNEIVKVRDLLRQLEKEIADKELKIEDLKGKRDSCDDAFSNAEMEAKKMWWRRREIDERVKAAVEGDEKMKDRLRSYILSGQNISKGF